MAVCVLQNTRIFKNLNYKNYLVFSAKITKNTSVPQSIDAILIERNVSDETALPRALSVTTDMIGPPHPLSNLRPIIWYRSPTETLLQRKLRDLQEATQRWNQQFWELHNTNFVKERKMYMQKHLPADGEKQTLTADEMSGFYKEFLDKNWKNHVTYNFEWYRKNFHILFLSVIVNLERLFQRS